MNSYIIIDNRDKFVADINARLLIDDDRDINVLKVSCNININDISALKPDIIIIADNMLENENLTSLNDFKVVGYLTKKDNDKTAFSNAGIKCIGFMRNTTTLLDAMEFNIDTNEVPFYKAALTEEQPVKPVAPAVQTPIKMEPSIEPPKSDSLVDMPVVTQKIVTEEPAPKVEKPANSTAFCSECGSVISPTAKFCSVCGHSTLKKDPTPVTPVTPVVPSTPVTPAQAPVSMTEKIKEKVEERVVNQDEVDKLVDSDVSQHHHNCKIVTVYAAKGGVGKTTISSELAAYLSMTCTNRRKTRVCIVDYNIDFGDVVTTLDFDQNGVTMLSWASDIAAKIEAGENKDDIKYSTREIDGFLQYKQYGDGVGVYGLVAPISHMDSMLVGEAALEVMLKNLRDNGDFDYIVCDTGNNTRDSSYIALDLADSIFMICTQDVTTTNCNESFLKTMEALDFDESKIKLVINCIKSAKETGISVKDIEGYVKFPCVARIRDDASVIKANNCSTPLVFNLNHVFTKEIAKIADLITDEDTIVLSPKKSIFKKLMKK